VVEGQPPSSSSVLLFEALEPTTGPRPPQVWKQETYDLAGVPWCGLVEVRASTCGKEEAPPACFYEMKFD